MKQVGYVLLILMMGSGCDFPEVRFDHPQPEDGKNLKRFPRSFIGEYINLADSSILTISRKSIIQVWDYEGVVSRKELNIELDTIVDGNLVVKLGDNDDFNIKITIDKDSARYKHYRHDIKFKISDKMLLRKYKGYLFLNYEKEANIWDIDYLKLDDGHLLFEHLASHSNISSLKEITTVIENMNEDSTEVSQYIIKPTQLELKKIIEQKTPKRRFKKL